MTLGGHMGAIGAVRYRFKEGGGGGFHSMMRLYPAEGIGTVVMANSAGFDAAGLLDRIDESILRGLRLKTA